jgi:dihydrolipoamide dehydrogenase
MVVGRLRREADVVVIGAGPGGYVAALRAADLGLDVVLVEERERPGGVCLLEGCIPSKALIHVVELLEKAKHGNEMGLSFGEVKIDSKKVRAWAEGAVTDLTRGVRSLLKSRNIDTIKGRARFTGSRSIDIEGGELAGIDFKYAIIATGSSICRIPSAYDAPVWSSADALELREIPKTLLVVGGGYIGLEMGLIYAGLGSKVTVCDHSKRLLGGADPDLVDAMLDRVEKKLDRLLSESSVKKVAKVGDHFSVDIEYEGVVHQHQFDQVLVAVGRAPNTSDIGLEKAGVTVGERGVIPVDRQGRTNIPHIFAIGDVAPGPMLAHKASREGKIAAETIAGHKAELDHRAVPAVVFTDPEIAWTGLNELEAKAAGREIEVARFPLTALGRARTMGRTDGFVKMIFDPKTHLILGVGIVAAHASELIAEGTLAIEMGATLEDVTNTIHPHPTLSEALMEAAEVAAGTGVHVMPKKRVKV